MRCFLALPLAEDTRDALCRLQADLRVGRPVARENLHLTLAFLGEQTGPALEDLHEELEALSWPGFELTLRGTGCFGATVPRVVFAGADPVPGLVGLHRATKAASRRAGLVLQKRRFQPHVTFSRLKPQDAAWVAPFLQDSAGFYHENGTVTSFALFRSRLRPGGASYEILAEYTAR